MKWFEDSAGSAGSEGIGGVEGIDCSGYVDDDSEGIDCSLCVTICFVILLMSLCVVKILQTGHVIFLSHPFDGRLGVSESRKV